ncbi:ATP-binding protein [Celerinatantimonas sp. YJH-8]|uniref:ATP-binding protein n=1 Tax=Celerinatantimonas sp. YJH-8 TaxID=3228714 RepID=UPI0038C8B17C
MAGMVNRLWLLVNSLFIKILLSFWGILLLTLATGFIIIQLGQKNDFPLPRWATRDLHGAHFILQHGLPRRMPMMDDHSRFPMPPHPTIIITDQHGTLLNEPELQQLDGPIRSFIYSVADPLAPKLRILDEHQVVFGPLAFNDEHSGESRHLYLLKSLPSQQMERLQNFRARPEILLIVLVIFSLIACMAIAWHIARPLKKLRHAANQIAMGDLSATLPDLHRRDEIGHLAKSLSNMSQTMANAITNQRRLLSDISHELRSPLTRLNMAVALSYKRHGPSNELARIEKESQRLEEMIRALLGLSRMQLDDSGLEDEELNSLLEELANDCQFEAGQLGKTFQWQNRGPKMLRCYPDALISAIENLCRNAIKYAEHRVELLIEPVSNQTLKISVQDDGPGIDEKDIEQIFRPFYRASEARDRDSGGVGLGLAIADWAVRQHGGTIRAENRSDHSGLKVIITLPYIS